MDGFIADQNINRAVKGEELDIEYLNSLTSDVVPTLIQRYEDLALPTSLKDDLGSVLACRTVLAGDAAAKPWQGYQLGQAKAYRLLQENSNSWKQYKPYKVDQEWKIKVGGEEISCETYQMMDY